MFQRQEFPRWIHSCVKSGLSRWIFGWRKKIMIDPSNFSSNLHCFRVKARIRCGSFFCSLVRRRIMPCRGSGAAPDGWVEIIRGPRPPSGSWPKVGHSSAYIHARSNQVRWIRGQWRRPQRVRASVPPQVVVQAERKRVDGIEATLAVLAAVVLTRNLTSKGKGSGWPHTMLPSKHLWQKSKRAKVVSNVSEKLLL